MLRVRTKGIKINRITALGVAVIIGVGGVYLMARTMAAGYVVQTEAESGTTAGSASKVSLAGASAGQAVVFGSLPTNVGSKKLLLHQQNPPNASFVAQNAAILDQLPFDGTTVTMTAAFDVLSNDAVSLEALSSQLAPLKGLQFNTMKYNFAMVYAAPAGAYTSWDGTVKTNFTNLATAARDAGLTGIFFDMEEYAGDVWTSACGGRPTSTCRAEAHAAGKAIMQSMVSVWPEVKILFTYGPWMSEPLTYTTLNPPTHYDYSAAYPSFGSFAAGMVEGTVGNSATFIDGGELYTQNTLADVQKACAWFKQGMATRSSIVPASLKPAWPQKLSCSQGVYDFPSRYHEKGPGTADMWRNDLTVSLKGVDEYVWAYSERFNWTGNPNGSGKPAPPADWAQASRDGWIAGKR